MNTDPTREVLMADEPQTIDDSQTPAPEPETADPAAEAEKWKALARKHEQRAKDNADKALRFDEFEQAQKSETEKQAEALDLARREASEAKRDAARFKVAVDKGLPADLIEFLNGDDVESLSAQADTLLARIQPAAATPGMPRKPVEAGRGGADPTTPPAESVSSVADRLARRAGGI